jgi:hypothetical protein
MKTIYECRDCNCITDDPAVSDASTEVYDYETGFIKMDRTHILLCPRCNSEHIYKLEIETLEQEWEQSERVL